MALKGDRRFVSAGAGCSERLDEDGKNGRTKPSGSGEICAFCSLSEARRRRMYFACPEGRMQNRRSGLWYAEVNYRRRAGEVGNPRDRQAIKPGNKAFIRLGLRGQPP